MSSPKYNRTMHLPWSPGATSDDKMAKSVNTILNVEIVITEKIDGSNTSLEASGCFARTHAGPPTHASFDALKAFHAGIKHKLPDSVQLFGEWAYAIHSIEYSSLPGYFLLFNVRDLSDLDSTWYSWDEVVMWAEEIEVPTVPVLFRGIVKSEDELRSITDELTAQPSLFGETREGVVIRVSDAFQDSKFSNHVMKWVRKNHVQTSDHWKTQEIVKNRILQQDQLLDK